MNMVGVKTINFAFTPRFSEVTVTPEKFDSRFNGFLTKPLKQFTAQRRPPSPR